MLNIYLIEIKYVPNKFIRICKKTAYSQNF